MKTSLPDKFRHPYAVNPKFKKPVAYFSMEFALDQALKTYSGGLGFLAGSHLKSAFDLRQNLIGIGILWKYGYYDQVRSSENLMEVLFREKQYSFLEDTGIKFQIQVHQSPVWVKVFYLDPRHFFSAPLFFLTTDIDENDYLARSISFRLYDDNTSTKIAQCILLGIGGAKFLDALGYEPDVYHLNEAHALSAAFHLFHKFQDSGEVRKRLRFTTHTPEEAGNEKHDMDLLQVMGFFGEVSLDKAREISGIPGPVFNHTLAALRLSKKANGVSELHGKVSREMWKAYPGICDIIHITNAQNKKFWVDQELETFRKRGQKKALMQRKILLKQNLFQLVADQTGKLFRPEVLTIVWARRFAGYKRTELITRDQERFVNLMNRSDMPVQMIWAGKPYPKDEGAIHHFNHLVKLSQEFPNMAVLTGYELDLSKKLKDGADIWLNTPVVTREASGTSGMTAAMNGALNFSTDDGWVKEFARNGENSFVIPPANLHWSELERDYHDLNQLYQILEEIVLPTYYLKPDKWAKMVLESMKEVGGYFDSSRMVTEYYKKLY
ncbi:MAG: alpha-glucan family phosphorylase [Chitinophagaceae bacterium]